MNIRIALLCCLAFAMSNQSAQASMIYGTVVDFGYAGESTFDIDPGDPPYYSGFFDNPFDASGAPDEPGGIIVQIDDNRYITLEFGGALWSSGTLSVFTWDKELPGSARIDLSVDGNTFFNLTPEFSDAQFELSVPQNERYTNFAVATPFRYVRFTDLVDSAPGGGEDYLNFDLNAVGFEGNLAAVPEPTSMALLGLGTFGFAVSRRIAFRRRRVDTR